MKGPFGAAMATGCVYGLLDHSLWNAAFGVVLGFFVVVIIDAVYS